MPKMNIPPVNLDLTLEAGKQKAITAAASGKSTEYVVKVDQLRLIPNFNVRVRETDDYRQHLEALKQSIRENGFYPNKPLGGYIGKDGEEDVIYVTDGHTRLEAVQEINDEAVDEGDLYIEGLPVVLKAADSTIADLTIALVQDNSGRPLTPYEMGIVVQRLASMKNDADEPLFSKADIARKLSVTERYIDDLNVLTSAPAKVRNAVLEGSVASTLAIQELRRDPKKAEERLLAAVTKAKASGKSKATKKHISSVKMQKVKGTVSLATGTAMGDVLKTLAKLIRDAVPHASKDDGDGLAVDGTISFTIEIPAPEAAPKAAKKTTPAKKSSAKGKRAETPAGRPEADDGEPVRKPPKVPTEDVADDPEDI